MLEVRDQGAGVQRQLFQPVMQVEQVAVLAPLQQGPQLGAEQFFRRERLDVGPAAVPVVVDVEWIRAQALQAVVLASVDLHLELEHSLIVDFGVEAEDQVHGMAGLLALALAQPGQRVADRVHRLPDGLGACLYQVDVFRVTQGLREEQLVDGRAAAESDLAVQGGCGEQVAQGTADDQVLLDLSQVRPWCMGPPGLDVGQRDHASVSTASLTSSFQRATLSASCANSGMSGLTDGSSST